MQPIFRRARQPDAPAIARIHIASWRAAYTGVLPASYLDRLDERSLRRDWYWRISDRNRQGEVYVLEHERHVVGFAQLGPCRDDRDVQNFAGEVYMLYLRPDHIGAGFGKQLLCGSMNELESRGYRWLVLWVLAANREARRFYRHMGLVHDGTRRRDWFDNRAVNVLRYARVINPVIDYDRLLGKVSR